MRVAELKQGPKNYVGQNITVRGVVSTTVELGPFVGYLLKDQENEETIRVTTQTLPTEGRTIGMRGT